MQELSKHQPSTKYYRWGGTVIHYHLTELALWNTIANG